jgi:hypothetical protein
MANSLGDYKPLFYANEALIQLFKALGMANTVHRGYDRERRSFNKGDTISIRRPGTFSAQTAPGSTAQDLAPDTVQIVLNVWQEVTFKLIDDESAYTDERIVNEHVIPATYALADKIDTDLNALYADIPWVVDSTGTSQEMTADDIVTARQTLFDNKAPIRDPNFWLQVDGKSEAELLKTQKFTEMQGAGDMGVRAQVSGMLGPKYGFGIYANQNVPTDPQGAVADAAGTADGGEAAGATSFAVSAFTASAALKKGTALTIAGHTQQYVLSADVTLDGTGAGTLSILARQTGASGNGGLEAALSGGEVVTLLIDATRPKQNLAYHRNAFAFAMARLPEDGNGAGARIASVQDPITGLAIRARQWYEGKESAMYFSFDVLYGVKTLDSSLAARLRTGA